MNFNFDDEENLGRLSEFVRSLTRLQKDGQMFKSCLEIEESFTRRVDDNGSLRYQLVVAQKYQNSVRLDKILEISKSNRKMQKMVHDRLKLPVIVSLWEQIRDFNQINITNLGIKTSHISILEPTSKKFSGEDPDKKIEQVFSCQNIKVDYKLTPFIMNMLSDAKNQLTI